MGLLAGPRVRQHQCCRWPFDTNHQKATPNPGRGRGEELCGASAVARSEVHWAGVWMKAVADQATADTRAQCAESPLPDRDTALWACWRCQTTNSLHDLHCRVASCVQRRPLLQQFRIDLGDWFCPECNNHNMGHRWECNWSACPTRDWRCECGNLNRSNRKFCNRRDPPCGLPRPHSFY